MPDRLPHERTEGLLPLRGRWLRRLLAGLVVAAVLGMIQPAVGPVGVGPGRDLFVTPLQWEWGSGRVSFAPPYGSAAYHSYGPFTLYDFGRQ